VTSCLARDAWGLAGESQPQEPCAYSLRAVPASATGDVAPTAVGVAPGGRQDAEVVSGVAGSLGQAGAGENTTEDDALLVVEHAVVLGLWEEGGSESDGVRSVTELGLGTLRNCEVRWVCCE
jgi:hypothetical protein